MEETKEQTRKLVAQAPKLIPIYRHRMMPDRPHENGNPVFSVHQTDIMYYGVDLHDYLIHEFLNATHGDSHTSNEPRAIDFWEIERFLDFRWADGAAEFDN